MITLQTIFASGWIQIVILLAIFYGFSRWAFAQGIRTGYGLGWLIGIFFIVVYSSLFPRTAVQVAANEPTQLTFLAVMASSFVGAFIALTIIGITLIIQNAWYRQIFATTGITAILVTMLFMMIMSPTSAKMGLTLSSLAFAIVIGVAYVARRAYLNKSSNSANEELVDTNDNYARLDHVREQMTTVNRT